VENAKNAFTHGFAGKLLSAYYYEFFLFSLAVPPLVRVENAKSVYTHALIPPLGGWNKDKKFI
jgi:hypothetical protein